MGSTSSSTSTTGAPRSNQVKRYQKIGPRQLRDAVKGYAGKPRRPGHKQPKRRFDPHRFVVVTSATTDDDTKTVDESAKLRAA